MSPLFQAKVLYRDEYILYDIFRTGAEDYIAKHVRGEDEQTQSEAPPQLAISKSSGVWKTEGSSDNTLCTTLGLEIDVFNNGYGDLLGRIGNG